MGFAQRLQAYAGLFIAGRIVGSNDTAPVRPKPRTEPKFGEKPTISAS